jgi:hypothetical protein
MQTVIKTKRRTSAPPFFYFVFFQDAKNIQQYLIPLSGGEFLMMKKKQNLSK